MSSDIELLPRVRALLNDGKIPDAADLQCASLTDGRFLTNRAPKDTLNYLDGFRRAWASRPQYEQDLWRLHAKVFLSREFKYKTESEAILLLSSLLEWQDPDPHSRHDMIDIFVMNAMGVVYFTQGDLKSARKEYERALGLRLKFPNPPEMTELLINYGNLLAKMSPTSREELTRATEYYRRAMVCDSRLCGPFENPHTNNMRNEPTVIDSLAQIHHQIVRLEQRDEKESCSRRSQIAKRLQAKLSQRPSQTTEMVKTALDLIGNDSAPSLSATAAEDDVDNSLLADDGNTKRANKSKKNRSKKNKAKAQTRAAESNDATKADGYHSAESDRDAAVDEAELARSPAEWRALLQERDAEHAETKDELETVSATLNDMILYCDRQQSQIDDLKREIRDLQQRS